MKLIARDRRGWTTRPGRASDRGGAAAGTPRGPGGIGQAWWHARTATIRRRARPRRAARRTARRSPPWHAGRRREGPRRSSIACAAASSHSEIVRWAVCMRPAASASSSPRRGLPASSPSAASTAASAMPAHVAAVRSASRENHGCSLIAPGPPNRARTGASWNTTRCDTDAAQPVAAIPALVDLDAVRVAEIDPHGERRPAVGVAGQHERAIQASGARAERLDAAQRLAAGHLHDGRGRPLAGTRVPAPDACAQRAGVDRGELVVAQLRRGLDEQSLDGVEVSVEDPPDRPIRARDLPHQLELGRRRRPDALGLGVPRERSRALERRDLAFRESARPDPGRGLTPWRRSARAPRRRSAAISARSAQSRRSSQCPQLEPVGASLRRRPARRSRASARRRCGARPARCRRAPARSRRSSSRSRVASNICLGADPAPIVGVDRPVDEPEVLLTRDLARPPGELAPGRSPQGRGSRPARAGAPAPLTVSLRPHAMSREEWRTCSSQCRPTTCPSSGIRAIRSGCRAARGAITKNVAGAPTSASRSSRRGVQTGSGPSSNVSAITLFPYPVTTPRNRNKTGSRSRQFVCSDAVLRVGRSSKPETRNWRRHGREFELEEDRDHRHRRRRAGRARQAPRGGGEGRGPRRSCCRSRPARSRR